ncbi:MAG: zinc finger domain-containing protein, partial [Candidatus Binatia bacterium]
EAIEYSESLDADARDLERSYFGEAGWRVYDREGETCGICNSAIKRIKQGGRSTFYCPKCQRKR